MENERFKRLDELINLNDFNSHLHEFTGSDKPSFLYKARKSLFLKQVASDIEKLKSLESTLLSEKDRAYALVDSAQDGIIQIDQTYTILYANHSFASLFETEPKNLIGSSLLNFFAPGQYEYHKETLGKYFLIDVPDRSKYNLDSSLELLALRSDIDVFPIEVSFGNCTINFNKGMPTLTLVVNDYSEKKKVNRMLNQKAYQDSLTGLGNRALLHKELNEYLVTLNNENAALLFVDLDGFKKINDSFGHKIGDSVLSEVALRLTSVTRNTDALYRYGGDEFVVLLKDIKDEEDASFVSHKVITTLSSTYTHPLIPDLSHYKIGASIGIVSIPRDGQDADALLTNADKAMYVAKQTKNTYQYYNSSLNDELLSKIKFETEIRNAFDNNEFELYYQPLINQSLEIEGFEGLIRWNHPERGTLSPYHFIDHIEESPILIRKLGQLLLQTASKQIYDLEQRTGGDYYITLNMGAKHIESIDQRTGKSAFITDVINLFQEMPYASSSLVLEITEYSAMNSSHSVVEYMTQLRDLYPDIRFALDDFGTGQSSIELFLELPVDILKIDMKFVMGYMDDPKNRKVIEFAMNLAHMSDMKVISEGVENFGVYEYLDNLKSDYFQGFYFAKPMPYTYLEKFIHDWDPTSFKS